MSWTDPCLECGEPRYACECVIEPTIYTSDEIEKTRLEAQKNKQICSEIGHDWEYIFILYQCKRCGKTTNY